MRVVAEAEKDERKWEALWSYRANPPVEGEGKMRRAVPFDAFLSQLGLQEERKVAAPEISDEEIEGLFKQGKMGLFPPGMKGN